MRTIFFLMTKTGVTDEHLQCALTLYRVYCLLKCHLYLKKLLLIVADLPEYEWTEGFVSKYCIKLVANITRKDSEIANKININTLKYSFIWEVSTNCNMIFWDSSLVACLGTVIFYIFFIKYVIFACKSQCL